MTIGYIGLGKMGFNMVLRLLEKKWRVVAFNRSSGPVRRIAAKGAEPALTIKELVAKLERPRLLWLMVPDKVVDQMLRKLLPKLEQGDVIVDGGNSHYTDTVKRTKQCARRGVTMLDAGVSGGPAGARNGACVMVGGNKRTFNRYEKLFKDIAVPKGYLYVGAQGAGHFVKMVHNGIEYGMMQALAEGFTVLRQAPFRLDLEKIAQLYNHRSVIESRLVGWLSRAYRKHGQALRSISGTAGHTGEGAWTVQAAKNLKVPVAIIEAALAFRLHSVKKPSYTGKILSALRNQFGGHSVK